MQGEREVKGRDHVEVYRVEKGAWLEMSMGDCQEDARIVETLIGPYSTASQLSWIMDMFWSDSVIGG